MKKIKQLFVVLVSLGLLASLCLNWSRHQVEQANRSMETVMDYQALVRMADSEGLSRQSVFKKFKDAGVTTLAVSDRTIMDMAGAKALLLTIRAASSCVKRKSAA